MYAGTLTSTSITSPRRRPDLRPAPNNSGLERPAESGRARLYASDLGDRGSRCCSRPERVSSRYWCRVQMLEAVIMPVAYTMVRMSCTGLNGYRAMEAIEFDLATGAGSMLVTTSWWVCSSPRTKTCSSSTNDVGLMETVMLPREVDQLGRVRGCCRRRALFEEPELQRRCFCCDDCRSGCAAMTSLMRGCVRRLITASSARLSGRLCSLRRRSRTTN